MGLLCPAHPQMLLVGLHVAWVAGAQVSSSSCEGEGEMSFFQCSLDRFCVCVLVLVFPQIRKSHQERR